MLSDDCEETLRRAQEYATEYRHEFTTLEHLLLALTSDKYAAIIFKACGVGIDSLTHDIKLFLENELQGITVEEGAVFEPKLSTGMQRVLQRSIVNVQAQRLGNVTGANVLVAMFSEKESHAIYFLQQRGLTRYNTVSFLSHGIILSDSDNDKAAQNTHISQKTTFASDEPTPKALEIYCVDITRQAQIGKIDKLIGRDKELNRMLHILCRRNKNNPLLVGEAGVGKTAIAEGLAHKIINKEVPEILADSRIFSLDIGALLAGTRYRGDFEERFKSVLNALEQLHNTIVFIDEIHTIVGAGASSGSSLDASNMLKPSLTKGTLKCIGSTTYKEYRQNFEKDRALLRRFQKIDVPEPSVSDTIKILKGIKGYYEDHHNLKYSNEAVTAAVELSKRFIHYSSLPDKAIDVIDEAGAAQMLLPIKDRKKHINVQDIEQTVAKIARIPSHNLTRDDRKVLRNLSRNMKSLLFGQDEAVNALFGSIKLSRAGLREEGKPIGSYLFTGPTGVGKTEASKQLALNLGMKLIRFDMSEYMERHAVSKLVGAPPGYVGFEQGGLLTDAVDQKPHAVLLLDEIEKAHPDIYNVLLQVMDYGKLTDSNGKSVDFSNVILIMTSNAGEQDQDKPPVGFARQERLAEENTAIKKLFTPEFRNRLDNIIVFKPLSKNNVRQIVDKEISALEANLHSHKIELSITNKAKNWLADKGFSRSQGARPLSRLIEKQVKQKLADQIIFGKLRKGGCVEVTLTGKPERIELEVVNRKFNPKASQNSPLFKT